MNLGALMEKSARLYPTKTATSYDENHQTYTTVNARANSLANALLDLGIRKGDRVTIIQRNCPQLLESLFACFKAGFIAVPVNARSRAGEISYIMNHSKSSVAIFEAEYGQTMNSISQGLASLHLVCLSKTERGVLDFERLIDDHSNDRPKAEANLNDIAWLFYTSGTTGKPKGAKLTHRNLMAMTMNFLADLYSPSAADVALHAAPLTHGSGLYAIPLVARGVRNIILKSQSFDTRLLLETIEKERVTLLPFLTPTMIKLLLMSPHIGRSDLSSLRCVVYGGSPMYIEDMKEALARFGNVFVQIYGQGEAPMTITSLRREDHLPDPDNHQSKRLASAGPARTDVEVRVFDENHKELPPLAMGEIVVRGDVVMEGYWEDAQATTEALRDGWLHTGDLGYMDEFGYVYLLDRKKDLIISGGSNIYPREVEEVVLQHPAVQEVAVIGVPDPVWGEAVKAIVIPKPGVSASEDEIIEFCRAHLASYRKPKSVEFVSEIPKNAYGKVLKKELREKYWAGLARNI